MPPVTPTAANAAVIFLDLQVGIVVHSTTVPQERLAKKAALLAQVADLHDVPAFASSVPPGGAFLAEVAPALRGAEPRPRTQTTAFADAGLVDALKRSGRSVLVLAGCASEIVVQRTALDGLAAGYTVHVLVDACGGVDQRTEEAAWRRIVAAGGVTSSVTTFIAELAGDFTSELGGKTLGLMLESMSL